MIVRLDTYKIIKRLTNATIIEKQAAAIAKEIVSANQNCHPNDLLDVKLRELKALIESRLEQTRTELLKWFVGISFVQTSSIIIASSLGN
ncbi:MAG: hypothetical protein ACHP6I_01535 [Rickettsiales bacterium]